MVIRLARDIFVPVESREGVDLRGVAYNGNYKMVPYDRPFVILRHEEVCGCAGAYSWGQLSKVKDLQESDVYTKRFGRSPALEFGTFAEACLMA